MSGRVQMAVERPYAVRVRGLGKLYRSGVMRRGATVYDKVSGVIRRRPVEPLEPPVPPSWALRGISFDVKPGEVMGLIGRNGAGKSTLLKILARTTFPTEGAAVTYGRVAALLQVGTGFHPDLTGRENIKLSGAILGMSKPEIEHAQDPIIAFAEIGKYLDTPVKYYSSGMYMRLAFSVSIHLAAEIMLLDEILAVGDAAFRRKCEERIRQEVASGRTVMFVSHSMGSVQSLCDRVMVLENGRMYFVGTPREAIDFYSHELLRMPA
jgi:lipopolysaccharide transport system ATP-binding protein